MSIKEHTLNLLNLDDEMFIIVNRGQNITRIITRSQYERLLALLEPEPLDTAPVEKLFRLATVPYQILQIMVERNMAVSARELLEISQHPKGTVSSVLSNLKKNQLIEWVDSGRYRATAKGIEHLSNHDKAASNA